MSLQTDSQKSQPSPPGKPNFKGLGREQLHQKKREMSYKGASIVSEEGQLETRAGASFTLSPSPRAQAFHEVPCIDVLLPLSFSLCLMFSFLSNEAALQERFDFPSGLPLRGS